MFSAIIEVPLKLRASTAYRYLRNLKLEYFVKKKGNTFEAELNLLPLDIDRIIDPYLNKYYLDC